MWQCDAPPIQGAPATCWCHLMPFLDTHVRRGSNKGVLTLNLKNRNDGLTRFS